MKVLVTGATGFVGSHSAAALLRAGHDVRLFVRDAEKAERVFGTLGVALPEVALGDVTDAASVGQALEGCDAVLHAAALVALDARQAEAVERTNWLGTKHVIGEAHCRGLGPIVYVSSVSALFDPGSGRIGPDSLPHFEPGNPYSESKARTEGWVRELQGQGAPLAITYPPGVLGPHAPALTEFHRGLLMQLDVALVTSSGGVSVVDVRDLAAVHARLFTRSAEASRWIVSARDLDWREVIDHVDAALGRRIPRIPVPGGVLRGLGRLGDLAKRIVPNDLPLTYEAMVTATRWPGVDASATVRELDVVFRDPQQTFDDTLRWLYDAGFISRRRAGRLASAAS